MADRTGRDVRRDPADWPWSLPPSPVKLACFFCDGETYNPDGICGQCRKDGKSYDGATWEIPRD